MNTHGLLLVLIITLSGLVAATTQHSLSERATQFAPGQAEALYLPNASAISMVSFGYKKVFANYLWFRTINYFGKHYASDQKYPWLNHMCDLVTTLDPGGKHVYEFCSTMLAWEVNSPNQAKQILTKGIDANPDYWKFPYLRGFVSLYFLNDEVAAKEDFMRASGLPDVHPMVVGMAAKTLAIQDDPQEAIHFLTNVLRATEDQSARKVIFQRLKELAYERDLRRLEAALNRFITAQKHAPAAIEELAAYLDAEVSLSDPFGGVYTLDAEKGTISSSSNHKRLGKKQ